MRNIVQRLMRLPSEILHSFRTSQDLYPHWGALTKSRSPDKPGCPFPPPTPQGWAGSSESGHSRAPLEGCVHTSRSSLDEESPQMEAVASLNGIQRGSGQLMSTGLLPPPVSGETMHLFSRRFQKRGSKSSSLSHGGFYESRWWKVKRW